MALSAGLRDRVASALIEAAAGVLAERGPDVSMSEVAAAAGISRATLYRYFPTREVLVRAIVATALDEAERRLRDADLDTVELREALARLTRTLIGCAAKYAILASDALPLDRQEIQEHLGAAARAVLRRGADEGALRQDLTPEELFASYGALLKAAMRTVRSGASGLERASSVVVSLFLDGAQGRPR